MTSTLERRGESKCGQADRGVVRLSRRGGARAEHADVGVEVLPVAVGFGVAIEVRPRRLWIVPGTPARPADPPGAEPTGRVLALPVRTWVGADDARTRHDPTASSLVLAAGSPARSSIAQAAPLRLTARGQAVLLVLAAVSGLAVVVAAWFGANSSTPPARSAQPAQVVVHDGDTLWGIAARVAPGRDPRVTVDQLLRINGLDTSALVPGQVLRTH